MSKKLIYFVSFILVLGLVNSVSAKLVAHWKLDEGSGTIVHDAGGNGLDGTIQGNPKWVAGKIGGALEFDGTDGYVDCGNDGSISDISEIYSVQAWAYFAEATDYTGLFQRGDKTTSSQIEIYLQPAANLTTVHNRDSIYYAYWSPVPLNQWVHIAVVWEKQEWKVYYDGVEQTQTGGGGTAANPETGKTCYIGLGYTDYQMKGIIDDVRIYNQALTEDKILFTMEGGVGYPYSSSPAPKDGTLHDDTWISLGWQAGDFAVSHNVYVGDNFDDVDSGAEGTFQGNQTDTFIVVGFPGFAFPDGLVPGTTYYWRIDEVNDTEPNSPWKSNVWSFSIPPKTAYFSDPVDNAESVSVDVQLSWTPGFGAKLHTIYFGDNFYEVSNAAGGLPQGTATYTPGSLELAKTYYWRVDEFDVVETHKGDVWNFTTEGAVGSPHPANGAEDVTQTPVLTWVPGVFADTHEVYFGADEASLELKGSGNLGAESFEPGQLEWNTTYYWRIDEANNANADSPWTGPLWSFTTANFLIVDDFEAYNDLNEDEPGSNRIYLAWIDGFENPAVNGSVVGNLDPPFAEQTIVHGGSQSMPMAYDNAVGKSEATLTLTSNRDWTVNGVNTLTIWFRGESANAAENLYVAINDSAVVTNDNPDAAKEARWTEWDIDLQAFADQGVNLANVNSITLGFGNRANPTAGGSGMIYFDDIRLYPPKP
ncbi:MAG: LamG domain-containing protein [Planctomycetes bacterium]|nr:LamG domain-containing protein [Planctomycetota bacterium]MBL7083604.1 LamG domain-containing protein [Candidatus Aminicenantes bacterium]